MFYYFRVYKLKKNNKPKKPSYDENEDEDIGDTMENDDNFKGHEE